MFEALGYCWGLLPFRATAVSFLCLAVTAACSSEESSPVPSGGSGGAATSGSGGAQGGADSGGGGPLGGAAGEGGAGAGAGSGGGPVDGCCGPIGPAVSDFSASGPITLTSGQTVTGLHITNPLGACIVGSGVTNVLITNCRIGPCGDSSEGVGISLEGASSITVDHNHFEDVASAFYVLGSGSDDHDIVFRHNYATEVRGPMPRGQLVQFNQVSGAGHLVECNVSDQAIGGYDGGPEDHISMFSTSGTAASPVRIRHNRLRGGGSSSGGGIMTGDFGSAYITVESNILVDPGQYGIAIAGGHDIKLLSNDVYAAQNSWTNVGGYVWLQSTGECYGHEVRGNRINFTNRDGVQNAFWDAGNCGAIDGMSDNAFGDESITAAIWDADFADCP
jgi:hypothetical protein